MRNRKHYLSGEIKRWINDCLAESQPQDRWDREDERMGVTWGFLCEFYTHHYSQEPIEFANEIYVYHHLKKKFGKFGQKFWEEGGDKGAYIHMLTKKGEPTVIAWYCWDNFVYPYQNYPVLDDELYSNVESLNAVSGIYECLNRYILDDVIEMLNRAEEHEPYWGEKYPAIQELDGWKAYPQWVYDVWGVLLHSEDEPRSDYGYYTDEQILKAAHNMGLLPEDPEEWSSYIQRELKDHERQPMVMAWFKINIWGQINGIKTTLGWFFEADCEYSLGQWIYKEKAHE